MATQSIKELKAQGNLWYSHVLWKSHKLWLGGLFTTQTFTELSVNN